MSPGKEITPKEKFLEISALFRRLSDEMCKVVEAYYVWKTLVFARSIPEAGKEEAEKNTKTMNSANYFFSTTEHSLMQTFIMGLTKFFDKDSRALSFSQLIKIINENKDIITSDVILEIYPERFDENEIKENYILLSDDNIQHINALQQKQEKVIGVLKNIRDKQLAHTDIETIDVAFIPIEVEELIRDVQEMFNKLSNTFDRSTTIWDHIELEAINDTKFLLENLERGESQRVKEIEKEYS